MVNKKDEEQFEEMVNESIEDLSEPQCDEQSEPSSARYIAMDDAMIKPYKDDVHSPSHYDVIDTTVEEMIEKQFTHEELMGWFKGNVLKYRLRAYKKGDNGTRDINKADEYQKFYDEYVKRNTPNAKSN